MGIGVSKGSIGCEKEHKSYLVKCLLKREKRKFKQHLRFLSLLVLKTRETPSSAVKALVGSGHLFPSLSFAVLPVSKPAFCFLSMYQSYLANGLVFSEKSHLPISSTLVQLSLKLLCLINCGRGRTGCVIGQLLSRELEMHHFMSCTEKGLWLQILMLKESLLRSTSFFSWSDGFM